MEVPLLQTKLHRPPPRTELVPRRQLIDHLSQVQNRKLTLISAPAGFGKTTLATSWLNQQDKPVAWVSLDEADSDPTRFFTHFPPALNRLDEDILPAITDRVAEAIGQATRSLSVLLLTQPAGDGRRLQEHLARQGFAVETSVVGEIPNWLPHVLASPPGAVASDKDTIKADASHNAIS